MIRSQLDFLREWRSRPSRKPLVIRGARQVGKTWLVRQFAKTEFEHLIEFNFDQSPESAQLFDPANIHRTLRLLESDSGIPLIPGKTLLFLDEIQDAPDIFRFLRYLFEEKPELHVIAAGSLLEFLLASTKTSIPVGRLEYLHLGPLGFREFQMGLNKSRYLDLISDWVPGQKFPPSVHSNLMQTCREFMIFGGMPGVLNLISEGGTYEDAAREQSLILQSYEDDFSKYEIGKPKLLRSVLRQIPNEVGQKLVYSRLSRETRIDKLKQAIELLEMAKMIYRVYHSSGIGLPLGASINTKVCKPLHLDCGLLCNSLGLRASELELLDKTKLIHSGPLAEQFVGQHLLYLKPVWASPELYYWSREKANSAAEVDYLYASQGQVIPVEVKAGKSGSLKSLILFAQEKSSSLAIRFYAGLPALETINHALANRKATPFQLLSLPLYMVEEIERLVTILKP